MFNTLIRIARKVSLFSYAHFAKLFILLILHSSCGSSIHTNSEDIIDPSIDSNLLKEFQQNKKIYKIFPLNEINQDTSLINFVSKFKSIILSKDTEALFSILDTNIIVSYGGGVFGIKAFAEEWKLNNPETSELWDILKHQIDLGGTWEEDSEGKYFSFPYAQSNKLFEKFDEDFDWYFTGVSIKPSSTVYLKPDIKSEIVGTLSYDIVELDMDYMWKEFTKITTFDKKISGYVKTGELIYSAEPYIVLRKTNGKWKMTAFAPFD